MNISAGIILAALGEALWSQAVSTESPPQGGGSHSLPRSISGEGISPSSTNNVGMFRTAQTKSPFFLETNTLHLVQSRTNALRPLRRPLPAQTQLQPGVYETWPYTCIVVVPGPHPDDKSMPGGGRSMGKDPLEEMPTIKPDLQFIPRKSKP